MTKRTPVPVSWSQNEIFVYISFDAPPSEDAGEKKHSISFTRDACHIRSADGEAYLFTFDYQISPDECAVRYEEPYIHLKLRKKARNSSVASRWLRWGNGSVCAANGHKPLTDANTFEISPNVPFMSPGFGDDDGTGASSTGAMMAAGNASAARDLQRMPPRRDSNSTEVHAASHAFPATPTASGYDPSDDTRYTSRTTASQGSTATTYSWTDLAPPTQTAAAMPLVKFATPPRVWPGRTGIDNIGNTCFVASVVQSLTHCLELQDFFLSGRYKEDINRTNPLGFSGCLAVSFAALMSRIWSGEHDYVSPERLMGRMATRFTQFRRGVQQDAQEFLAFLLDGLHEDLNRVQDKPNTLAVESKGRPDHVVAAEAWATHLKRNSSFFVDHMQGQFRSQLVCPKCDMVSIMFDPFMYLTVPIAEPKKNVVVLFIPRSLDKYPVKYVLSLAEHARIPDIGRMLSEKTKVPLNLLRAFTYADSLMKLLSTSTSVGTLVKKSYPVVFAEILGKQDDDEPVITMPLIQRRYLPPLPVFCANCGFPPRDGKQFKRCTVCLSVVYCGRRCQNNHWTRSHQSECVKCPRPTAFPAIISLREADFTYDNIARWATHYSSLSLLATPVETSPGSSCSGPSSPSSPSSNGGSACPSPNCGSSCSGPSSSSPSSANESPDSGLSNASSLRCTDNKESSPDSDISKSCLGSNGVDKDPATTARDTAEAGPSKAAPPTDSGTPSNGCHVSNGNGDAREPHDSANSDGSPAGAPKPKGDDLPSSPPFFLVLGETDIDVGRRINPDDDIVDTGNSIMLFIDWRNWPRQRDYVNLDVFRSYRCTDDKSVSLAKARGGSVSDEVSLQDCLEKFTAPETLDKSQSWYCPKCKVHRQATKQMSPWKLPNLLIIHLKRFNKFASKITAPVSYPIMGLDMSSSCPPTAPGQGTIYDLFAVVKHFGHALAGHYTAYCKEQTDELVDDDPQNAGNWLNFDDRKVASINSRSVVHQDAYLLFYRLRPDVMASSSTSSTAPQESEEEEDQTTAASSQLAGESEENEDLD